MTQGHGVLIAGVTISALFSFQARAADDPLVTAMLQNYKAATVFLKSTKETLEGEVVYEYGTGFIVSAKGHVITSCHVVDSIVRDKEGKDTGKKIKSVTTEGVVESRYRRLEPMGFIACAINPIDLALLKFSDGSKRRTFIPIKTSEPPSPGDTFGSLGYPLDVELFARTGKVGPETPTDTYWVDITLNPGDSGGPVFNKHLGIVGVAEGGYPGAHIGIVRPIRHAGGLLSLADVQISAVGVDIQSQPYSGAPIGYKVEVADPSTAIAAFAKASSASSAGAERLTVTYPFAKIFLPKLSGRPNQNSPNLIVGDVKAKPGYKIVDSKFIVLENKGAHVLNVSPQSGGTVARTSVEKDDPNVDASIRGFVQTTQVKDHRMASKK